jgi:hypothetical protein
MKGNGYIEIEIEGKKLGLKFNMYAFEQWETIRGGPGKPSLYEAIYVGMLGNCYVKQIEPPYTFEDMRLLDNLLASPDNDEPKKIHEVFAFAAARARKNN